MTEQEIAEKIFEYYNIMQGKKYIKWMRELDEEDCLWQYGQEIEDIECHCAIDLSEVPKEIILKAINLPFPTIKDKKPGPYRIQRCRG